MVTVSPPADPTSRLPEASAHFREAMSHLATGVVLVTTSLDGRPWGMTVSAACPICVEPPTMLVSLGSHTALSRAVAQTGRYGVNILGAPALPVARFGSTVGTPKFLDDGIDLDLGGEHPAAAVIDGALAHVDCEVVEEIVHATHSLFIGRGREVTVRGEAEPLIHFRRAFHRVIDAD